MGCSSTLLCRVCVSGRNWAVGISWNIIKTSSFFHDKFDDRHFFFSCISQVLSVPDIATSPSLRDKDISSMLDNEDPYGQCQSAGLRLLGRLIWSDRYNTYNDRCSYAPWKVIEFDSWFDKSLNLILAWKINISPWKYWKSVKVIKNYWFDEFIFFLLYQNAANCTTFPQFYRGETPRPPFCSFMPAAIWDSCNLCDTPEEPIYALKKSLKSH